MNDHAEKLVPGPAPKWENRKGILISAAVVVLAFCALGGWWFFR